MKGLLLIPLLFVFLFAPFFVAAAGNPDVPDIELTWETPTARTDGAVLLFEEIEHYNLYYGADIIQIPKTENSYIVEDVSSGLHSFKISTVDSDGLEGPSSSTVEEIIPKAPITVIEVMLRVTCSGNCVYEIGQVVE